MKKSEFILGVFALSFFALFSFVVSAQDVKEVVAATQPEHAEVGQPTTSLHDLLDAASKHYPSLRASQHKLNAAKEQLDEATWSPFFQWTGEAGLVVAPEQRGTAVYSPDSQLPLGNAWKPIVSVGIRGGIPLYTFGKYTALRRAAKAGIQAARGAQAQSEAKVRLDVIRAYFALQVALDGEQMLNEGLDLLRKAEEKMEEMLDEGEDVGPNDSYRLQATIAEINARASQVARAKHSAMAALRALTGVKEIRVPDCPLEAMAFEMPEDASGVQKDALQLRPEIIQLDAARKAKDAELDIHVGKFFPDLALVFRASYSYGPGITNQNNPFVPDPANFTSLGAGLAMRWNLDLVGETFRYRRIAEEQLELDEKIREAQLGISLQAELAFEALADAKKREKAWRKGHKQTRAWFVSSSQGYQMGTAEPKDLIDAMKSYFTARYSHLQAIFDYNSALVELDMSRGGGLVDEKTLSSSCAE